jgi:formylglycine-generating enzyme required for sulfatase activity
MFLIIIYINNNQKDNFIKRRIAIINSLNSTNSKEYQYLSEIIRETIKVNILKDIKFRLINFSNIDNKIDQLNLDRDDYTNQSKLKEISLSLGSDILIFSEYKLQDNELILSYQVFDLLIDDISLKNARKINTGVDIFNSVDGICNEISKIINRKYDKINKLDYEKIIIKKYGKDKLITFDEGIQKNIKQNIKMVHIKGGNFIMGDEKNYDKEEIKNNHIVVSDFWISNYEVTQMEWLEIMGNNPSRHKGELLPVENINWYNAVEFCNKKSMKEGLSTCYKIDKNSQDENNLNYRDEIKWTVSCDFTKNGYRLPTEAEWEYAAKGGEESMGYEYSGSNDLNEVAWFYENSNKQSHFIGQKIPNELGLYDMSGNVYEWCWDWYDIYDEKRSKLNPKGPTQGKYKIIRGGCMNNKEGECRSYDRTLKAPYDNLSKYGLRIVKSFK